MSIHNHYQNLNIRKTESEITKQVRSGLPTFEIISVNLKNYRFFDKQKKLSVWGTLISIPKKHMEAIVNCSGKLSRTFET